LVLTLGSASAEISIVADLDSNYTNGPDTLVMDPGDTVLVRVWITGEDSLVAWGMTLGDTSGALQWVEEEAGEIYTVPGGWTGAAPGFDSSTGWLLLQATDFSLNAPMGFPSMVANLRFTVGSVTSFL